MVGTKFIAWTAFTLFVLAVSVALMLVFSPLLDRFEIIRLRTALWGVGVLAFLATVTGFASFKTAQGKVAAIGGLLLLMAIVSVTPVKTVIFVS